MGRTRYQEGSLRLESRKRGKVWRLRFRITRADGNRVEHAIVIGTQKELPTRATAREFVKSLYLPINHPAPNNNGRPVTFSDIAVTTSKKNSPKIKTKLRLRKLIPRQQLTAAISASGFCHAGAIRRP
jgi:hypothetical protein